jgi:hypothetical protein
MPNEPIPSRGTESIPSRGNEPIPARETLEGALPWPVAVLMEELLACYADWPVRGLVQELLVSHFDWRKGAAAAAEAYRRWSDAPTGEAAQWFPAYTTALDQEEAAAMSYAVAVTDIELWLDRAHEAGARARARGGG